MTQPGDRQAFERLVLPHMDAAYNVARHLVRHEAVAADVVQESLMRAWRYFGSFRGGEALPWLLQIVRNAAYSMMDRKQEVSLPEDMPVVDAGRGTGKASDPAVELIEKVDAEMLRQAVDALPVIYREVIVLRELEGLSYKEIADVTGVSIGTVMSRLSRGRRQLETAVLAQAGEEARHDL